MSHVFYAKLCSEDGVRNILRSFEGKKYHRAEIQPSIESVDSNMISNYRPI